jgi:hypothetical protein
MILPNAVDKNFTCRALAGVAESKYGSCASNK